MKVSRVLAVTILAAVALAPLGCKKQPPAAPKGKPAAKASEKAPPTRLEEMGLAEARAFGAPEGVLVEADSPKPASDCEVVDDLDASGGKAVKSAKEGEAIFMAPPPEGEAFTVWVRHCGGPLCLKSADAAGVQKELHWIQAKPEKWAWSQAGRYTRQELGPQVLVTRGPKTSDSDPRIDCVVFAPDPEAMATGNLTEVKKELPPFEPDPSLPPASVSVTVNWAANAGRVPPFLWGINDSVILDPKAAADGKFQTFLKTLRPPLVRVHQADLADQWTSAETKKWDVEKIKAGFAASTGYGDAKLMIALPGWPKWMADPAHAELLAAGQEDAFAALGADLARILRDEVKRPVAYWELLNEKESGYEKAGRLADFWKLFNTVFDAMRTVDHDARIGGPAFTWPKPAWVEGFLKNCGRRIDFISWHSYASGDLYDSNRDVLARPAKFADRARTVAKTLKTQVPDRSIEMVVTEYNIDWSPEPVERRHANNVGAVFDACVVKRMAAAGIDTMAVWNAKGNAYGLVDGEDRERPAGRLYRWGAAYLSGRLASAKVDDEALIEALPVVRGDGVRSLLLINKSGRTVTVPARTKLLPLRPREKMALLRLDAAWPKEAPKDTPAAEDLALPGYSVTLLTTAPEEAGTAKP